VSDHVYTHYISGPMRGKPDHNRATFMAVEDALRKARPMDRVINPCRNFDGKQTLSVVQYMEKDLQQVIEADQIVLLPGWEESQGALREIELGKWLDKDFALAAPTGHNPTPWRFEPLDGAPQVDPSPRAEACDEAKSLITGDRNNQYGPPTQDFKRTAAMANGFGFRVVTHDGAEPEFLKAHHVAIFMMLLKTSRLAWTPAKRDSWVDDIGYAGCGYECAVEEETEALAAMNATPDVHAEMVRISEEQAREYEESIPIDAEATRKFFASVLFGDGECEE
jgi:hypothetical protein